MFWKKTDLEEDWNAQREQARRKTKFTHMQAGAKEALKRMKAAEAEKKRLLEQGMTNEEYMHMLQEKARQEISADVEAKKREWVEAEARQSVADETEQSPGISILTGGKMSYTSDIWDDSRYSIENYIGKPADEEDFAAAEEILGYRLPESYKQLMREHNGGILKKNAVSVDDDFDYYVEGLLGVDPDIPNSLVGSDFDNSFWIEEWGYPEIGIAIADTPSAGHDMFFLDYSKCGPEGEPSVVLIDQEADYSVTHVADSFEEFLQMLHE